MPDALLNALLFVRIVFFAAFVPLMARLPIRRLQKVVEPIQNACIPDPRRVERIVRYTDWFCRAARPFISSRCMTRGLTLYFFLRRAGVDCSLVFGVGNDFENFAGHCWLVQNGEPFLEKTDPRPYFTAIHGFNESRMEYHRPERIEEVRG